MVTDDERLDEVLDFVKSSGWLEDADIRIRFRGGEGTDRNIYRF